MLADRALHYMRHQADQPMPDDLHVAVLQAIPTPCNSVLVFADGSVLAQHGSEHGLVNGLARLAIELHSRSTKAEAALAEVQREAEALLQAYAMGEEMLPVETGFKGGLVLARAALRAITNTPAVSNGEAPGTGAGVSSVDGDRTGRTFDTAGANPPVGP